MSRQKDDDLLSILDFNFTLDQVLTRIATNTGWVSCCFLSLSLSLFSVIVIIIVSFPSFQISLPFKLHHCGKLDLSIRLKIIQAFLNYLLWVFFGKLPDVET